MVTVHRQGLGKRSVIADVLNKPSFTWTSRYASVSFTWIGVSMPTCGMNSKGLAISSLIYSKSEMPKEDDRFVISISQWKQYVLDTCRNVEEALDSLKQLRLTTLSRYGVHYILADATGRAAIIQFVKGRPRIFMGRDLPHPVLTNDLDYAQALNPSPQSLELNDPPPLRQASNYRTRFERAAQAIAEARKTDPRDLDKQAWKILDQVRIGGFTRWNIVFDLQNRTVVFRTDEYETLRRIDLKTIDLTCPKPLMVLDINARLDGDLAGHLTAWHESPLPGTILEQADQLIRMNPVSKKMLLEYPRDLGCFQAPNAN